MVRDPPSPHLNTKLFKTINPPACFMLYFKSEKLCFLTAMVYGSLHFITFDGSEYSFNALGEFVILRLSSARGSNIFTLQGQIEKLHTAAQGIVEVPVVVRMAAFHQGLGKVRMGYSF